MTSAFKNFFITFAICLLVFGFIGFQYIYPQIKDGEDFSYVGNDDSENVSDDTSPETSEDVSVPVIDDDDFDENGDVFTAVVMCVDSHGRAVNTVFIDSNSKSKQYIYCPIPSTTKRTNEVGATVSVGDMFSTMAPNEVCQAVSAMTGIETQYCLKFTREDLPAIAALIPGASFELPEDISFVNPEYKDFVPAEGEPYPDDYFITISNVDGKVLLNEKIGDKTKLEWILSYTPNADGSEYNAYYSLISKALIRQFFQQEVSTMSTEVLSKVLQNCETNLTISEATTHLSTIFKYNDYPRHEITYPSNWSTAVQKLRDLDGSFNR